MLFSLCPFPLFLWLVTTEKPLASSSLPPHQVFILQLWPHPCWAEGRVISSLHLVKQPGWLLATFAMGMHCWHMVNLMFTRALRSFSAGLLPSCLMPARPGAWGYSLPGAGLDNSICWTWWGPCQPVSPSCWGPSEWQHTHLLYQLLLPILYHLQTCWVHSIPLSR